jgi:hypothetical protein
MKSHLYKLCSLLFIMPSIAFAGWQVAQPTTAVPNEPFLQAGTPHDVNYVPSYANAGVPTQFATLGRPAAVYAISVSGSLKENVERIMCRYHWKVKWKAPYDFNFDGRVTGSSLPNVIQKLLNPFPLQAILYMSNRTMIVVPRNL